MSTTDEYTTVAWTILSGDFAGKTYIHDEKIIGYISHVEFFSLDEYVYSIINRFYDPVKDTYHLDSWILKIGQQMVTISKY